MKYRWYIAIAVLIVVGLISSASAQEHDHQQWNEVMIGRFVALARIDAEVCNVSSDRAHTCSVAASQEALGKLHSLTSSFDCQNVGGDEAPTLTRLAPMSQHDVGSIVIAEQDDMRCRINPRRQLFPIAPGEFKQICSQLKWKCDVVWISDSDQSVWYISRTVDIP